MPLNERQTRFAEEYAIDFNASAAARRAGYSEKTAGAIGWELLKKPEIQEAIESVKKERSKRTQINADWVLKKLVTNAERAAQAEPVLDREGNPTGEYTYQGNVVNKALELIGQHVNFFPDKSAKLELSGKVDHEHSGNVSLSFTDEIDRLAAAFTQSADREEEGDLPSDDPAKPVDS